MDNLNILEHPKQPSPKIPKTTVTILILVILILGSVASMLLWERDNIIKTSDQKIREFQIGLADSKTGFTDSDEFILPIDKKFEDEVATFIAKEESFIEIDLSKMEVSLYKDGRLFEKLPVLSKGKDGSWWETPTGKYKIISKEQNHFSSIGNVWMPWSMQFYGNFFIHGWPYYEDGRQVSSSYSGGCVRLSTSDAKKVFQFANKDMAILLKDEEDNANFAMPIAQETEIAPPNVSAKSFLVSDIATGEIILGKNSSKVVPIASLAKMMTGIVASELVYLGRPIAVDNGMLASAFSNFHPVAGERYVAFDLLYPLLMQSSNQAANILAGYIGKEQFVTNMNKKAFSLSMNDTNFADASGELSANTSSAEDIEKLLRYTYFKRKFLFDISKGEQDYRFEGRKLDNLQNFNELVGLNNLVGIKNGETKAAGQTLAGVWEFNTSEGKIPIGIVVLDSTNRAKDAEILLNWLKQAFDLN
jgi:serine-type D-Ala-D-Ala endopeptidase (penicillin-binding protein 7)